MPGQATQLSPLHSPQWPWLQAAREWSHSQGWRKDWSSLPPRSWFSVGQFLPDITRALLQWSRCPLSQYDIQGPLFHHNNDGFWYCFSRSPLEVKTAAPTINYARDSNLSSKPVNNDSPFEVDLIQQLYSVSLFLAPWTHLSERRSMTLNVIGSRLGWE